MFYVQVGSGYRHDQLHADVEPPPRSASHSRTSNVRRDAHGGQCQKCQKGVHRVFGTFGAPLVSVLQESHALLGERRSERPGAVPLLVCHDGVVIECDADKMRQCGVK